MQSKYKKSWKKLIHFTVLQNFKGEIAMSTEHLKSFYVNRKELTVTYKGYCSNCFNADGSHAWYSNVQHYPNRQKFNDALLDFANEVVDGVITLPASNTFKMRIY